MTLIAILGLCASATFFLLWRGAVSQVAEANTRVDDMDRVWVNSKSKTWSLEQQVKDLQDQIARGVGDQVAGRPGQWITIKTTTKEAPTPRERTSKRKTKTTKPPALTKSKAKKA